MTARAAVTARRRYNRRQQPMMNRPALTTLMAIGLLCATSVGAQFRRGVFSESTEITLYPVEAPALLLPPGTVQVEARNASSASARILERLQDRMARNWVITTSGFVSSGATAGSCWSRR